MNIDELTSFLESNAVRLAVIGGAGYGAEGRGMLLVGFKQADPEHVSYITLEAAKRAGFSAGIIEEIERYAPECQAVLYANCGDPGKVMILELDGAGGGPSMN